MKEVDEEWKQTARKEVEEEGRVEEEGKLQEEEEEEEKKRSAGGGRRKRKETKRERQGVKSLLLGFCLFSHQGTKQIIRNRKEGIKRKRRS